MQERLPALDGLRAIAALAVLFFHYTSGYEHVVGPHIRAVPKLEWGHFGVELFFIISGFVIAWTLQRASSPADFAWRRIARLYPAYLVVAAITAVVIFGFGFNPAHVEARDVAWNAIPGLPPLVPAQNIDPSYWTLGLEISFYVMAAAVTFGQPKLRFEIFCLLWLAASLITRGVFADDVRLRLLIVSDYSPLFVAGAMLFALVTTRRRDRLTMATLAAAIAVSFIGADQHWLHLGHGIAVSLFVGVVFLASTGRLPFLGLRPLVLLGEASYSLYLIHQIAGYWIIANLERLGVHPFAAVAIATVLVVLAAFGLRIAVERPAQRLVRGAAQVHPRGASAPGLLQQQRPSKPEGAGNAGRSKAPAVSRG
jgi:peptidoglycan/LPS O-acetylase OafA/YrhL